MRYSQFAVVTALLIVASFAISSFASDIVSWNEPEVTVLKSLWIGSLPPLPDDPSNAYDTDPRAAELGRKLFFDSRFSGNLKVSCATCHPANMNFADNLPLAHGLGTTTRRTMPLIGAAYNTWFFWDGRKDSLWSQALGPIESPVEHGFTRIQCVSIIIRHYKKDYEDIFGPLPDLHGIKLDPIAKPSPDEPSAMKKWISIPRQVRDKITIVYVNMGKAIAAYVRTIVPGKSRFDEYVEAVLNGDRRRMRKLLSDAEVRGLKLFIGDAQCVNCHNGPMLTNGDFHNINVPQPASLPRDRGRAAGIGKVLADEFNCLSRYSDAGPGDCAELKYMDTNVSKYEGAFKTPTLRNVAERAPYMHAGQFSTLKEVLHFYRDLPPEKRRPELAHGDLTDEELQDLEAFLHALSAPPMELTIEN